MCLAWMRPAGAGPIPESYLQTALMKNPDGAGFAAYVNGELRVERFLPADRKAFVARYRAVEATGATIIGHARLATHGSKTIANTHPYEYVDPAGFRVLVIHNGVLRIQCSGDESDTAAFVRLVLAQLPSRWWTQPALMYLVSEAIGYGNKLVMLTAEGETVIVNEDAGTERSGIWYSNTYSLPYTSTATTTWYQTPTTKAATAKAKGSTPADPNSKRTAKRKAQAARKATRTARQQAKAVTTPAFVKPVTDKPATGVMTHAGHLVSLLVDVDRATDGEYEQSVVCDMCQTTGDVWAIDGQLYLDLPHIDRGIVPFRSSDNLPF